MNDMNPKGAIELDIAKLDKSKAYPEENVRPKDGFYRYPEEPGEQYRNKKDEIINNLE